MTVTAALSRVACALACLACTLPAFAQTPADTLPRLSPKEIEIRGELRVSFPSIARPPLSGFAPAPRLKTIDDDRQPYLPSYRQTDLPPSPLARPTPPTLRILATGPPRRGVLEAGAGSYFTRFGRFYLDAPASPITSFYASADYEGSYGHDNAATGSRAPFDLAQGEVGVRSGSRRFSIDGRMGGFYRSFTLHGAMPDGSTLNAQRRPDREGYGGSARVSVDVRPQDATSLTGALAYYSTFYDSGTYGDVRETRLFSEIDEARVTLALGLEHQRDGGVVSVSADGGGAGLDGSGTPGTEQLYATAGLAYTFVTPLARLRAGARVLRTRFETLDGSYQTTLISPDVRAQLRLAPGVELYAQNRPHVETNSLATLFAFSPYLVDRPDVRPTAIPWDAEGGVRGATGDVQLRAWVGYLRAPRLRYFSAARPGGFTEGSVLAVRYAEGQSLQAGAEVRTLLVEGLSAALGGLYRQAELTRTGEAIPYVPAGEGWATLGYASSNEKLVVELKGTVEGVRYSDPRALDRVAPYADLDATASFAVTPSFTVVGRLDNLIPGNRTWWKGYPEAPFTATAGLSIRW